MFQNEKTAASGNNACRRKNKRWLWLVFVTCTILWMSRPAHAACPPTISFVTTGSTVTSFARPAGTASSNEIIGTLIWDNDSTSPCGRWSTGLDVAAVVKVLGPSPAPYVDNISFDGSGNVLM